MKLRLKELEIESDVEGAIRVEDLRLVQELNGQPRLTLKFLMEEHTAAELVRRASDIAITVREHAFTGGRVVFSGKAEELWTATEKGLTYLWLDAYPYTREWERTEKSRSFLNASMTYMDVAGKVLSDYGQADIRDEVTKGALIPGMLLQYEESDWAFLRRLASHFGTCLIADCTDAFGRVYFGIPHIHYGTALTSGAYTLEKDLLHYDKVLMPQGILSQEVSRWKVKTRRFLSMGEEITLNRIPVVVTGQCIRLEKGELVYGYELSRRVGIRVEQEKNSRISGMSIPATVKERSGNRIRVQFDIDKEYDPAGRFFTYALESSSFYCMPEPESRVHIYFPGQDEQDAIAVHAIASGSGEGKNPDNKRFSDPSGSAMDMTPDSLCYSADSEGTAMLYMANSGQVSLRGVDIRIKTQKGLTAGDGNPPRNVFLSGGSKVVLRIGEGGSDAITMESGVDIASAMVEHTAEASPEALPAAEEILQEISAGDKENRETINAQVTNTLIANKQASRQKFIAGVVSIATVAGTLALTVVSGGAAAPLFAAALPKAAFAAADIAEGLDGHSKVNALDASRPANFIRDNLLGGNQALYDGFSAASDVLFDVVTCKAAADLPEMKTIGSLLCRGSKAANAAAQLGGSVIFGAVREYAATGSVSVKGLAVYTGAGLLKGLAGNVATAKLLAAAGTESAVAKKAIGWAANTAVGTAVDVAADLYMGVKPDIKQILTQNMIASALGQLFGEPVDVVSGAFLITAADFILPGIRGPVRLTRRYSSARRQAGLFGQGWQFPYEGRLCCSGSLIHVELDTGRHVMFEWEGGKAKNTTPGCGRYALEREEEGWLLTDRKEKRTYRYGKNGLLLSVADQNGLETRFSYHGETLETIVTPLGCEVKVTTRAGRITQLEDGLGRSMRYAYENGLLTEVTHMDRGKSRYEYDGRGFLTRAVDQAEVAYLENQYDGEGRVVRQTLANGDTYRAEYLDGERRVRVHSSVGGETVVYRYGKAYEILSAAYEDGTETVYEYEGGYRTGETDRLGRRTSRGYDDMGRMVWEETPAGLATKHRYDENGDLAETWDNAGRLWQYFYDEGHNVTEMREKAAEGASMLYRHFQYDRKGRLIRETDACGNATVYVYEENRGEPSLIRHADGEETRCEYDAAGRRMAWEDACGREEYGYNARNFRTMVRDGEGNETHAMYDGMGRLLARYTPKAWKAGRGEYVYKYDFLDRLTDTIRPDGSHERRLLDGEGNILKKIHPNAYEEGAADEEGTVYEYDGDGNNIRIRYPDGGCERIFYDAQGSRIKHVLPEAYDPAADDGTGTAYAYDAAGRLVKVTGADGAVEAEYAYDLAGNLVSETDAVGNTSHYACDLRGKRLQSLVPAKEADGRTLYRNTTYTYDGNGNLTGEHRLSGYWDRAGKLREEEGIGLNLSFTYDCRGRLIRVEDGLGAAVRYMYDARGNRVYEEEVISETVRRVVRYVYDRAGRLTEQREELDSGLEPEAGEYNTAVAAYGYDENGNRIFVRTPEGYLITREYDGLDRLARERVEDRENGIDRTTEVSYDKAGNIIKLTRRGGDGQPWEIRYGYDLKDRIIHAGDCLGPVFRYEYDRDDRLRREAFPCAGEERSREYTYDCRGKLLTARDNEGNLQEEHRYRPDGKPQESRFADGNWIAYTYGVNGLEKEIHTARSGKEGRAAQEYTYDARGRITGVRDGNRNVTGCRTDAWGRVRRLETAEGGKELYTYDCAGNVTSTTDANGGTITYRYNSRGKVCEITDQEGNRETFCYDREGRMASRTDRNGNQVRTAYNVDGNPVMERACGPTENDEVTRTWQYDGMGNRKKAVAGGFCYTYEYRPDGKLIRKASSGKTHLSCTYNEDKSLRTLTDASGNTVYYGYDSLGRLESIRDETGEEIVRYGHTAGGKLKEIRHGNGMHMGYEYDTDGNVTKLTLKNREGEVFSDFEYAYDMNGNRTMKSGRCILPGEERLKGVETRYRYDCMNRLLEEDCGGKAVRYAYDRCGNRKEKLESTGKEVYTYNEKNQLTQRENGASHFVCRYDPQGNILEECGPLGKMQYRYNALNQQTEVTGADGRTQENRYDGESLRAAMTENGRLSGFLYYNGELLAETGPEGSVENRYILGYGVAAGRQKGKEGYHSYHQDEQNSTAYILDAEQRIENSYGYDAFGVILGKKEGIQNRILYTGQQYDQVTGQVYLRARYYNPAVGRFLQEDEYRGDGLNLYAYCRNNPVTYFDPSGYCGSKNCKNDNDGGRGTEGSSNADTDALIAEKQAIANKAAQNYNASFNPARLGISKGYEDIRTTANGGVTFEGTQYMYPVDEGQLNRVSITAQGNRPANFDLANRIAELESTPSDAVWHHLDDYNVKTGNITLELVYKDAHRATVPHAGGCAQYDAVNGPSYNKKRGR